MLESFAFMNLSSSFGVLIPKFRNWSLKCSLLTSVRIFSFQSCTFKPKRVITRYLKDFYLHQKQLKDIQSSHRPISSFEQFKLHGGSPRALRTHYQNYSHKQNVNNFSSYFCWSWAWCKSSGCICNGDILSKQISEG